MSITVHQVQNLAPSDPNGIVPAIADRRLYNMLVGGQNGVVSGCQVTLVGSTQLRVADGWGIIGGCMFTVEDEIVDATMSSSGTVSGRLVLQIDVSQSTATFIAQAQTPLPELTQEDLTAAGNIYEMAFATYNVDELAVTNLQQTFTTVELNADMATQEQLAAVQAIADAAMPRAGGYFTGNAFAPNINYAGSRIRNVGVITSNGTPIATGGILMTRK